MINPLHELVLKCNQGDSLSERKIGVWHLSGSNKDIGVLRVKRYGSPDDFWHWAYLLPSKSTGISYCHPNFEGEFYVVTPSGLELVIGNLKVHDQSLSEEEQAEVTRRTLISCGTRTTFYWGGSLKDVQRRLTDLWPELREEERRDELLGRNARRYIFPYRVDDYRPEDPGLIEECPEAKGCNRLGTRVIQVVTPRLFKEAGLEGWTINYLCPEHAEIYFARVKERDLVQDINVNNGITSISQGHHRNNGTWINTGTVFPSRVHVIDSVQHLLLTFEQRAMFRESHAVQADGTPRQF